MLDINTDNDNPAYKKKNPVSRALDNVLDKMGLSMRSKLIIIFLIVKIIPLILLAIIAWLQFSTLGDTLREISIDDSSAALNNSAVENIERMTTDTAKAIADFLYDVDNDIIYASTINPSDSNYEDFLNSRQRLVIKKSEWVLSEDGMSWVEKTPHIQNTEIVESSNPQNNDNDGFNYRPSENFEFEWHPTYDEITFIDLNGVEQFKYVSPDSSKVNFELSNEKRDISKKENTYVKAEAYFEELKKLKPGEIYVSDVIGSYVPSHFIGMYTPKQIAIAALNSEITALKAMSLDENESEEKKRFSDELLKIKDATIPDMSIAISDNDSMMQSLSTEVVANIESAAKDLTSQKLLERKDALVDKIKGIKFAPEEQAFAGKENPMGKMYEGIVRWGKPVTNDAGVIVGYVTLALNQEHITEFVDQITPMIERYVNMPSAFDGNYAFIWDYKCRSIAHPRHHSIVGFDETTGNPQVPWLESSIFNDWQESGKEYVDFIKDVKTFDNQSRDKIPAPELTKQGLVGLDGRYLNNAPQCTGWMDLTSNGGSGSFYILWSGLYKLTTAGAIPYYTGQYADSPRGFGFVTIGAGLEDFTRPAIETEERLNGAIAENTTKTIIQLAIFTSLILVIMIMIALWLASFLTDNILNLISGISRFRSGERQFRFNAKVEDEFGTLANAFDDMADSLDDSVNTPIVITNNDLNIIYLNSHASILNSYTPEESIGKTYFETSIYPENSLYDPILALKEGREAEVLYVENVERYVQGIASYFLDKDGNEIGYIIRTNDMTEMIRRQHELEKAVDAANKANEHKSAFLARMSHEIRTPMNAIIGLTNIVEKKINNIEIDKDELRIIQDDMNKIESSSQHLLGLLNDILDVSKIEAGKIELSDTTMDIERFVEIISDIIKPRCEEKNIRFVRNVDNFEQKVFQCDSLRLRQVLINLLGNAVKFTPELGQIDFNIKQLDRKDEKCLIRFEVVDNGMGIPEDKKDHIFERFEQADASVTRTHGGTGLGLSISQHIVNLLGGNITVESTVGEGSEFSFEIWLQEHEAGFIDEKIKLEDAKDIFAGKRALVVDDVEINRLIVSSILDETGIEIDEAADGAESIKLFEESEEGTYDIVLMDIQMPVMDGYEASIKIRELDRDDAKSIPIIALTANAFKDDIDKATSSGMNSHVAKPVDAESLIEAMLRYLRKR